MKKHTLAMILFATAALFTSCGPSEQDVQDAYNKGKEAGYNKGYLEGFDKGKEEGYQEGYNSGMLHANL
ncbi:MAG: hypothetical protein MJ197_07925 [Bacteroidales bacterium]|nr:hypothetical protein [Bacteroidales bacterium]